MNVIEETMNEIEHYQKILKSLSREQLEDEFEDILILLFYRLNGNDEYHEGWNDSRESIIKLCKLEKYRYNGK